MSQQYTEVTQVSWVQNILKSLVGALIGLVLFIVAFPVIIWNEGSSVDRARTLTEGRGLVVSVSDEAVSGNNEGRLIHFSGTADTSDILNDQLFGVSEKALKLRRIVEMYQWKESAKTETEKKLGGGEQQVKTYIYDKIWSEAVINSETFKESNKHSNPPAMPFTSSELEANRINVGAFELTNEFSAQIAGSERLLLTRENFDQADDQIKSSYQLNRGNLLLGKPQNPQIGDVRISFEIVKPQTVSLVGKQSGNTLETYHTTNGEIALLAPGLVSADGMFAQATDANQLSTWVWRLGTFLLIWLGLALILYPAKALANVLPIIGSILGAGILIVTALVAFMITLTTTALIWLTLRPLIALTLLVLGGGLLFALYKILSKSASNAPENTHMDEAQDRPLPISSQRVDRFVHRQARSNSGPSTPPADSKPMFRLPDSE